MKKIIILGKEKPAKLGIVEDEKGEERNFCINLLPPKRRNLGSVVNMRSSVLMKMDVGGLKIDGQLMVHIFVKMMVDLGK